MNALKERAGVVAALVDGTQTVLVRRPDLPPSGTDGRFALYPAYTHQRPERYSPRHEHYYRASRSKPDDGIPIRALARVVAEYDVSAEAPAHLAYHYVYSEDGLREKYDLGEARVLLVRVAVLGEPLWIDERPAYRGCRTWIELEDDVSAAVHRPASTPVLEDDTFDERRAAVEAALAESEPIESR